MDAEAYLAQGPCILHVVAPQFSTVKPRGACSTQVALKQICTVCAREAWTSLLALVHIVTASGTTPISSHASGTRSTLKLNVREFSTADSLVVARVTVINTRICSKKSWKLSGCQSVCQSAVMPLTWTGLGVAVLHFPQVSQTFLPTMEGRDKASHTMLGPTIT